MRKISFTLVAAVLVLGLGLGGCTHNINDGDDQTPWIVPEDIEAAAMLASYFYAQEEPDAIPALLVVGDFFAEMDSSPGDDIDPADLTALGMSSEDAALAIALWRFMEHRIDAVVPAEYLDYIHAFGNGVKQGAGLAQTDATERDAETAANQIRASD